MYVAGQESPVVESIDDLKQYFVDACKPPEKWRVGTEHEMVGVVTAKGAVGTPVPYRGPHGLSHVLDALVAAGWEPIREGQNIIALLCHRSQVSIEPGGQLEHAARPHKSSQDQETDLRRFLELIRQPSADQEVAWLATGFRPWGSLNDVGWVPKKRYEIMRAFLPRQGALAHEMMKRTATVQVNLDYASESDAHRKMRAIMSVTSILTAIYANSCVVNGAVSDYQSYRGHVWTQTDPDRCGLLPFVFLDEHEDGFFSSYTQWALDVPMFFVYRDDTYLPVERMTFRQFMDKGFGEHRPTMDDWGLHLSTLFPDGRMKQFLVVRGCDASTLEMTVALGAFCCGFLYDEQACEAAIDLTRSLAFEERLELATAVNRQGLSAKLANGTLVAELAEELLEISRTGLRRRDSQELGYLDPIAQVIESRRTYATNMAELWAANRGEPEKVIPHLSYHS